MKNIEFAPGYMITDDGRVWSAPKKTNNNLSGKWLTQHTVSGYKKVELYVGGKKKLFSVHRLVAEAYLKNPYNKPQVNHINGDKLNNAKTNLEWCTALENMAHAKKLKLRRFATGMNTGMAKLTPVKIQLIKLMGESKLFSNREISKLFCVSEAQIHRIISNENWDKDDQEKNDLRKQVMDLEKIIKEMEG